MFQLFVTEDFKLLFNGFDLLALMQIGFSHFWNKTLNSLQKWQSTLGFKMLLVWICDLYTVTECKNRSWCLEIWLWMWSGDRIHTVLRELFFLRVFQNASSICSTFSIRSRYSNIMHSTNGFLPLFWKRCSDRIRLGNFQV